MNVSVSELLLVLLIALIVIKPEQLPGVAQSVGKFVKSVRHMIAKIKQEMNEIIDVSDAKK